MGKFFSEVNLTLWSQVSVAVFFVLFTVWLVITFLPARRKEFESYGNIPFTEE